VFLVWGCLDARAHFDGAVYPNSHHLALRMRLVSSKAQSMIGHRASVQSEVAGAVPLFRLNRKRLMLAKVPWPAVVCPRSEGGEYPCLCFSLAGGAQFVLFCSVLILLFLASFVFSFRDFCPRGLSALRAASFSGSSARVHVVWDSSLRRQYPTCRSFQFQLLWQYSQTAVHFGIWVEYESYPRGWASAFPPFGRLPTAQA